METPYSMLASCPMGRVAPHWYTAVSSSWGREKTVYILENQLNVEILRLSWYRLTINYTGMICTIARPSLLDKIVFLQPSGELLQLL